MSSFATIADDQSTSAISADGLIRRRWSRIRDAPFCLSPVTMSSFVIRIWSASPTCRTDSSCASDVPGQLTASTSVNTLATR